MNATELHSILACGEDSQHQFKRNFPHVDALATELIAFANGAGGRLFVGVEDDGRISGLAPADVARLNQLLSAAASQHVRPPVNPVTANVPTPQGLVMVITVPEGLNKPYLDVHGRIWVKSGADKRHVTSREEMQRMFQASGLVYADEVPAHPASLDDLDLDAFARYFQRRYGHPPGHDAASREKLLRNLNLARAGVPNLAGLLLFGRLPQAFKPAFGLKAVAFPGTTLHDSRYLDNETIDGSLPEQYRHGMAFIRRNLRHVQRGHGFNQPGELEVPEAVFEELLVNALVHRDYFINAPIRLLVFADRVEILSPGHLPNHLDTRRIRYGLSNLRNPALASHAFQLLPYSGLGSGIPRAVHLWPDTGFVDDRPGNQFKAVVRRPGRQDAGVSGMERRQAPETFRGVREPAARYGRVPVDAEALPGLREERVRHAPMEHGSAGTDPKVVRLLQALTGEMGRAELQHALGLRHQDHFREAYLMPALVAGLIEMTRPDKPRSSRQRYRLTDRGWWALHG